MSLPEDPDPTPAPAPEVAPRRRPWRWVVLALGTAATAAVLVAVLISTWAHVGAQRELAVARQVSAVEFAMAEEAVAGSAEIAGQIDAQRTAYRDAADRWATSEQTVASWRAEMTAPSVEVANPGGSGIPGRDADARALLDGIGAGHVQLIYDAGPQNCGYSSTNAGAFELAVGGCYNSRFRDWLFLAWDSGVVASDIWPVFVHEAMHWYQWDRYAVYFESAANAGISGEAYSPAIESDASCRAVYQHGIPRSAYDRSSAPCDVDGWHENWLVEQLAALGAPTAAPDPETFEVEGVIRP